MAQYTLDHLKYEGSNDIWEITDSAARGSLAVAYSASSTYAVGDIVLKDGQIYKCNTAITTAEAWNAAHWTAVTVGEKIADLEDDTNQLKDKADIDGYYQDMTVGDAEQLVASQYAEDSVPYLFRTTGGSADVGNREYVDGIVGGTVVWNQLASPSTGTETNNGITYTENGDGTITLAGTATSASFHNCGTSVTGHEGHKVLLCGCPSGGSTITYNGRDGYTSGDNYKDRGNGSIITAKANMIYQIQIASGFDASGLVFKPQFIDLTQMFGSTIADYIYSLEQATAGAGVAWFKKLFPKDYYEYNAGELISVSGLASHDTVGFNQWDEEWVIGAINPITGEPGYGGDAIRSKNYIPVLPNTQYYYNSTAWAAICYYDASKGFISREVNFSSKHAFTTPSGCGYIMFAVNNAYGTTYKNDICINLSWSGWRNGEYEPYSKHSYPLDESLTLRGIPKLDAQNNLYFDGDEYLPDGTVTYDWVIKNSGFARGSLDSSGKLYSIATLSPGSKSNSNELLCMNNKLISATLEECRQNAANGIKSICVYDASIFVGGFVGNEAELDTLLQSLEVIYKLNTPTTETAEPYQHVQICDDFGTEEYISTSIVPVGHNTRYPANLRDKLQHLPDLADDDGYYMIGQSNKQMHLELFRIPKAPTEDGTYTLKATVSGGTPTYTWEAQT